MAMKISNKICCGVALIRHKLNANFCYRRMRKFEWAQSKKVLKREGNLCYNNIEVLMLLATNAWAFFEFGNFLTMIIKWILMQMVEIK